MLKIEYTNQYILANLYIDEMTLSDIAIWENNHWLPIGDIRELEYPLYLISIPTIEGIENVKFVVNNQKQKEELIIRSKGKLTSLVKVCLNFIRSNFIFWK